MGDEAQARTVPNLADMQTLVLQRYGQARHAVMLFAISDAAAARDQLKAWAPQVTTSERGEAARGSPAINIGITWPGLRLLLEGDAELSPNEGASVFDLGFCGQPPDHPGVREQLGFLGESDPEGWWGGNFKTAEIHVAVYVACDDADQMSSAIERLRDELVTCGGLSELKVSSSFPNAALEGYRPPGGILHFGLRDGVTTPVVDWAGTGSPGAVNFREFVMGYHDETYPVPPQHDGPWKDFARDCSFACLAWMNQDVAAYNRYLAENEVEAVGIAPAGREREWVAAKMLGRWPDGSALSLYPETPPAAPDLNDGFGFADDPDGAKCPLVSHIRIVNCRDQPMSFANVSRFPAGAPRFIRRGFSYGEPIDPPTRLEDDGVDRGVIGTFVCARVNEQFYTALRWMQKTGFSDVYDKRPHTEWMQDALIGNRDKPKASAKFPLDRARSLAPLRNFVSYRGVVVFFLPTLSALSRITEGRP